MWSKVHVITQSKDSLISKWFKHKVMSVSMSNASRQGHALDLEDNFPSHCGFKSVAFASRLEFTDFITSQASISFTVRPVLVLSVRPNILAKTETCC